MFTKAPLRLLSSNTLLNVKSVSAIKPVKFSTFIQSKKSTQIIQTPTLFKIQKNQFSSYDDEQYEEIPTDSPERSQLKQTSNKFKKHLKYFHPDRFHSKPELRTHNEESLQKLNHFFDAIEAVVIKADRRILDDLDSPIKFSFALSIGTEIKPFKTMFYLPMGLFEGETHDEVLPRVMQFYENCAIQFNNDIEKIANPQQGRQHRNKKR